MQYRSLTSPSRMERRNYERSCQLSFTICKFLVWLARICRSGPHSKASVTNFAGVVQMVEGSFQADLILLYSASVSIPTPCSYVFFTSCLHRENARGKTATHVFSIESTCTVLALTRDGLRLRFAWKDHSFCAGDVPLFWRWLSSRDVCCSSVQHKIQDETDHNNEPDDIDNAVHFQYQL